MIKQQQKRHSSPISTLVCLLVFTAILSTGCGTHFGDSNDSQTVVSSSLNPYESPSFYFSSVTDMTVEVRYETGATPTGGWNLLEENTAALFKDRASKPRLFIPKTLAEMQEIPSQGKNTWTNNEVFDLFQRYKGGSSNSTHAYFWVVFLNGYYSADGSTPVTTTLGIQIKNTNIIAIFKPVVTDSGGHDPDGMIRTYIEQSTLIHEMGHALGLVNQGIPPKTSHHDDSHKGHCTNPNCVLYWQNGGTQDLRDFARRVILSGNRILFGEECLQDTREFQL